MKKKVLMLIFFAYCFLLGNNIVYAEDADTIITSSDVTVECIYADGSLIISTPTDEKISVRREVAAVAADDTASANNVADYYIVNSRSAVNTNGSCKPYLITAIQNEKIKPKDGGDPYDANVAYYKTATSMDSTLTNDDLGNTKPWYKVFTSEAEYSGQEVKNVNKYKLLSERVYIENESVLEKLNYKSKCYFVKKATQASGTNTYLTMYLFDNLTLVDSNNMITSYQNSVLESCPEEGTVLYFNDPASKIDVTKSSPKYVYDYAKFESRTEEEKGFNKKFEATANTPTPEELHSKNACEQIPETVKILKQIIGIMQIGVPIAVIVLTSLDIFKMVVAGNLDEELPKRKKIIIIRLIIMSVFFFLPLFVNLGLKLLFNSSDWFKTKIGISDIDCLFEQGSDE